MLGVRAASASAPSAAPARGKVGNGLRAALQAEVAQDALQLIHERLPLPDPPGAGTGAAG